MSRFRVDVYNDAGPTDPDAKQRQTYIGTEALRRVATDNGEVTGPSNVRWSDFIVTVNGVETNCGNSLKKAWKIKQEAEAAGKQANITKRAR